jgi:hypothetical protein
MLIDDTFVTIMDLYYILDIKSLSWYRKGIN